MLLQIDHHNGLPIYRQVIEQIRRQIMTGELGEGEQLVSVREMAEGLKVNPMTVSKAYALLEMEGLLERRRGVGLFVARISAGKKSETKEALLGDILKQAAVAAVQLGISEEEAIEMFSKMYGRIESKKGSRSNV
jgi:GntR family transcriptional regulator